MKIGKQIKNRRLELGLSVDELAAKLGKNRATVYRYESDDIEKLPITVLAPLAEVLDCSPSYLMGWTNNPKGEITQPVRLSTLLSDRELHLVSSFRTLPSSDQDDVIDYVDYRASKASAPKTVVMDVLPEDDDDDDYQVIAAHADPDITPEEMQENIRRLKEAMKESKKS